MSDFWLGKKVLLTGHTGFKGAWLTLLLGQLGAKVYGYALPAEEPSLFNSLKLSELLAGEQLSDIADKAKFEKFYRTVAPEITIHMAAQALVLPSYEDPLETYRVNVLGTATVLDVVRAMGLPQTVIVVTSDKVYENQERGNFFVETDRLGGDDPYSSSKACAEFVARSFHRSFFKNSDKVICATARAGNVVGAGDWSRYRLVPDLMRGLFFDEEIIVRHPEAVRPWQHVLEPLWGYLRLVETAARKPEDVRGKSFNFGPDRGNVSSVGSIIDRIFGLFGKKIAFENGGVESPHEATLLHLDSTFARNVLGWKPFWGIDKTLSATVEGYKAVFEASPENARQTLIGQIQEYNCQTGLK